LESRTAPVVVFRSGQHAGATAGLPSSVVMDYHF
jgi:hypothetical protein